MIIPSGLIERLAAARRVAVLTGAGVSAESGVPTFRDAQTGLWEKYRPEDLATPRAFRRNPPARPLPRSDYFLPFAFLRSTTS